VSVCVLGTRVDPAKTAEPIAGCFKMGRRLVCPEGTISEVEISPTGRGTFERGDVELPPHAVKQRSNCPAAEAVGFHFESSQ